MCLWLTYVAPGDASAGSNLNEKDIDRRVMEAMEMEDPVIIADLRHLNKNGSDKYSVFWTYCRLMIVQLVRRGGMTVFAPMWLKL